MKKIPKPFYLCRKVYNTTTEVKNKKNLLFQSKDFALYVYIYINKKDS